VDLLAQWPAQFFLDGGHLAVEPPRVPLTPVHLDGAGQAIAVGGEGFVASFDNRHHLVPFPFDAGTEGAEFVGQAALIDDIERPGDIGADTFTLVHRPDAYFGKEHAGIIPNRGDVGNNTGVKERIQKILANAGVASRRNIEQMVVEGRVAVNGKIKTALPILIDPHRDKVEVDGEAIPMAPRETGKRLYILINKPKGVYSTNVAQGEQTRVIDLLPPDLPGRVYPVGRLDAESKGLLLLTNDGELTNHLTHPRYGVAKTYKAVVDGYVTGDDIAELSKGVWLSDERTGKGMKADLSHVKVTSRGKERSTLEITLREGRNRQVRRMLARIGHKVRELTRVKLGPLTLHGLGPGQFRILTPREVKQLWKLGHRDEQDEKPPAGSRLKSPATAKKNSFDLSKHASK
jgi:pseudouridine synthase